MPSNNQHMQSLMFSHVFDDIMSTQFCFWRCLCPRVSSLSLSVNRYGSDSEDVNLGRWVKHAEDKHNIKVQYIVADEDLTQELKYLSPLAASGSDAAHRSCPSSVMPGIGLGPAPMNMAQLNVTTWEECRDLCCEKDDMCVSWTLSLAEKTCFLREQLGDMHCVSSLKDDIFSTGWWQRHGVYANLEWQLCD